VDARDKFGTSLYRFTNRLIQENDPGNLHRFMSQPTAQMLFQFRSFVMAAWVKNTLHGLNHFDVRTFMGVAGELVAGVSTYATLTHMRGLGRSDREEYLAERLSWDQLVLQGYARMAFASITPTAIDVAAWAVPGVDPIFTYARASGSAMDVVGGNPIISQAVNSLAKGFSGAIEALVSGRPMTQGEARALWRGLANNHMAIAPIFNAMISDLPERKQ
jgi:hypothetical protein